MSTIPTILGEQGTPGLVTTIRAISMLLAGLTLLVCCTRLYLRKFVLHSFGIDDYFVILSLILVVGYDILSVIVTYYGVGYHADTVPLHLLPTMSMIVYIANTVYLVIAASVKTSLTLFIMRVFPTKCVQWWGWGIMIFLVVFAISGELAMVFQCVPVQATWDSTIVDKKCYTNETLFGLTIYQGVLMFVVDVVIIVLPMPSIWKLQMPVKRRASISALFALGILSCVAALARLPTLVYQNSSTDYTYEIAKSLIWIDVEYNIGLMVGSLPTLRKLPIFQRVFGSTQESHDQSGGLSSAGRPTRYSQGSFPLQKPRNSRSVGKSSIGLGTLDLEGSESRERIIVVPENSR